MHTTSHHCADVVHLSQIHKVNGLTSGLRVVFLVLLTSLQPHRKLTISSPIPQSQSIHEENPSDDLL